jgi:hypothetical protein
MLLMIKTLTLCVCMLASLASGQSTDSMLIGEWVCSSLPDGVRRVAIYNADHTYSGQIDDLKKGAFKGSGTWRVEASQMICRDSARGESRAQILWITQSDLEIKAPDGIVSHYKRKK